MFTKNTISRVSHEFHFTLQSFISALCIVIFLGLGVSAVYAQEVEFSSPEVSEIAFSKDTSIRDALMVLSERFNVNIVPSAVVTGEIGFTKLRNVTFEQAMEDVLGGGFTYEQVGPTIRVYSQEEYDRMRLDVRHMVHKVFTLYYISATEAQRMIEPILSTGGVVQSSSPAELEGATVDAAIAAVSGGDTMADNDRLIVRDYPEKISDVEALIAELDVRPKQVLVEATIMSARLTEDTEMGIDWNAIDGVSVTATKSGVMSQGFTSAGAGLSLGISSDHVKGFIRALEDITDTTLLANPKILAVNKQLGQVYIGTKLGYRDASGVGLGGEVVEGEVKFLETGTELSFRPFIGNDGYIRMDIFPKDSTGELNAEGVPDERSTELATNIIVKDGQTVVIGGLFRDKVTKTRNQIPVLGNLPILGGLFRSDKDSTSREEMVILLTPHIIDSPDQIHDPEAVDEVARKHQSAKDAMQPMSRIKQAEQLYERACLDYVQGDLDEAMSQVADALTIRPNFAEAVRLKEKILVQSDMQAFERLPRNLKAKAEAMVAQDED
ncbi:MAG: type II secretion system protein GspD [Phycisphaeraceae bacterium]|nr:type II secretion system protein GspD [Phycisphaeraceae bacterium]